MSFNPEDFNTRLEERLNRFDIPGAEALCRELEDYLLACGGDHPAQQAVRTLQLLRRKRLFPAMLRVGDALIQTGRASIKLRRLYAQALIDTGALTAALAVLNDFLAQTAHEPFENSEARGLIGRVHKQSYINAKGPCSARNRDRLYSAITAYLDVYRSNPAERLWHGINAVALLARAARDGAPAPPYPDLTDLAHEIYQAIQSKHDEGKAEAWDYATAMEASIALNRAEDALKWLQRYLKAASADAFEFASTLRQLTEVWQLTSETLPGRFLLPLLRAKLLQCEGGQVELTHEELRNDARACSTFEFEKLFGPDSFKTYHWYLDGLQRCHRVGRIGRDATKGEGTGFLLEASAISAKFGNGLVLVTNAHVVSNDPEVQKTRGALQPEEGVVVFETLDAEEYEITELLWTSPPEQLDATILRLSKEEELKNKLSKVAPIPLPKVLPVVEPAARVYIIGYPAGGTLSISLNDNLLLDHQDPRIHYRTPTEGGCSGSPVFNRQWGLIGLHHGGSETMPRLNGEPGTYAANEGICFQAIKRAIG